MLVSYDEQRAQSNAQNSLIASEEPLHEFWMAETRNDDHKAFERLEESYKSKGLEMPKARQESVSGLLRLFSRTLEAFSKYESV